MCSRPFGSVSCTRSPSRERCPVTEQSPYRTAARSAVARMPGRRAVRVHDQVLGRRRRADRLQQLLAGRARGGQDQPGLEGAGDVARSAPTADARAAPRAPALVDDRARPVGRVDDDEPAGLVAPRPGAAPRRPRGRQARSSPGRSSAGRRSWAAGPGARPCRSDWVAPTQRNTPRAMPEQAGREVQPAGWGRRHAGNATSDRHDPADPGGDPRAGHPRPRRSPRQRRAAPGRRRAAGRAAG